MPRSGSGPSSNRKRTTQFSDTSHKRSIARQPASNDQNKSGPPLSRQGDGLEPSGTGQRQSRRHQDFFADEPPLARPGRSLLRTLSDPGFPVSTEAIKLRQILNTHIIPGKYYTEGIRRFLETRLPVASNPEDQESVESANRQLGGIALLYGLPLNMFSRPERDAPVIDPLECRKQAIAHGADALSPSTAANIKWLESEQTDYPMSIGRVVATVGCALSIYHTVFSQFQTHMDNAELIPTPEQGRNAHKLLHIGQTVYATENERLAELYPVLTNLLRPVEGPPSYLKFQPDGLIFVRTQKDVIPILVLETKNEVGTGGCDPEVQSAFSYRKLWSHDTLLNKVRNACCCPSFLLSIAGHRITIHGAVLAEGFMTEPLSEAFGTAGYSDNNDRAINVAKYFMALQKCLHTLSNYYLALEPQDDCELASFSPEFRTYGQNDQFNLTYTSANLLPGRNGRAMFDALLKGPNISGSIGVKVKFTTGYCPEAHELLAKEGLAPKLLHWERLSRQWNVVVMDSLPGDNLATTPQQPISERALKDIEDALTLLHSKDWVYGDLRRPNIITCLRDGAVEPGAMLVDFDWAGKDGEQRYPLGLSERVKWPKGVQGGEYIKKEHDLAMLDMLRRNKM